MKVFSKISFSMILSCMSMTIYAAPNIWHSNFQMGFTEYVLSNSKKQTIVVACNEEAGEDFDHGFHYYPQGLSGKSANLKNVSVRFNNKDTAYPPREDTLPTSTRGGANNWIEFAKGISKARKIDVYSNNKLVATFTPSLTSIQSVAKGLASCNPVGW